MYFTGRYLDHAHLNILHTYRYALTEAARQCQVETIDLLLQDGFSPFLALPDLEYLCSSLCPTLVTLVNQGFVAPVQKLIAGLPITDILWSTPTGPRLLYVALFSPKTQDLGLCLAKSFVSFLCKYSANWGSLYSKTWSDVCTSLKQLQNYTAVFESVHLPQINHLVELITFCKEQIGVSEMGLLFHTLCGLGKLNLVRLMLESAGDVKRVFPWLVFQHPEVLEIRLGLNKSCQCILRSLENETVQEDL